MNVLPVGSVVRARDIKLMIAGYELFENKEKNQVRAGYIAVKYPRGYAGRESLGILGFDEIQEVLKEGLHTPGELRFTQGLGRFYHQAETLDGEKWNRFMEILQDRLKEKKQTELSGR